MKNGKSPHYYLAIFWFLLTITLLCSGATPERPYYSETPNPRHIQNNDRLTAEYFNNQLNVIYNWAQRTHTELDNLLHNGVGVASLTVGILNCTNKIINPEWDNLLHNGNGVASITANLVKAQDLEIANSIDVPAIEFSGRSQPTPPVNNGMLYFDSDLQRFRVYQENAWRDLSSNYIINGTTLTNPLVIDGYLDTRNIYINENASISKNLNVQGNINSSGTTTVTSLNTDKVLKVPTSASTTLGVGSIYYDTTAGKLKAYNGTSWDIVGKDITVDSAMSSTSTNPVQNKVIYNKIYTLNTNMLASLSAGLDAAEASATRLVNTASSSFNTKLNNASSSLNTQFNNAITSYNNTLKSYVDTQDTKTLASATKLFVSDIATGDANGQIKYTKNGSTYNINVKGLGSAAYANVASFSSNTHNHNSSYVSAIATGDNNGTIKITKNDSTSNVAVKGLGSAAYANVASFSSNTHNHNSSYVSAIATGDNDGTIKVTKNGTSTNVAVKGLGSAAYANVASFSPPITIDSSMSNSSTNPVQNKTIKSYVDDLNQLVTSSYVYNVQEGTASGTIKITRGLQNTDIRVKGLGDAAFTNIASLSNNLSSNLEWNLVAFYRELPLYKITFDSNYSATFSFTKTTVGGSPSYSHGTVSIYRFGNSKYGKISISFHLNTGNGQYTYTAGTYGVCVSDFPNEVKNAIDEIHTPGAYYNLYDFRGNSTPNSVNRIQQPGCRVIRYVNDDSKTCFVFDAPSGNASYDVQMYIELW